MLPYSRTAYILNVRVHPPFGRIDSNRVGDKPLVLRELPAGAQPRTRNIPHSQNNKLRLILETEDIPDSVVRHTKKHPLINSN